MTETLISSLSQLPKLNVKARSSVFRYKGKDFAELNSAFETRASTLCATTRAFKSCCGESG